MKPLKIIDIERTARIRHEYPSKDSDAFYLASWGGLFATRLKSKYADLDIEVWKSEFEFDRICRRKASGVDCRVFPHKLVMYQDVTITMLWTMFRLQRKHLLVLYRSSLFDWKFMLLTSLLFPQAVIVVSHHGGWPKRGSGFAKKLRLKLLEYSLTKVHAATYLRKDVKNWIERIRNHPRLFFLPVGADFSVFKPLDKEKCREELGLEPQRIYAVYVGRFFKLKGVDIVLDIYREFKHSNFEVLFVGSRDNDDLYHNVVDSGCRYWPRMGWDVLVKIYSAADFYIHPAFHPQFGGLDVTLMESLACGTPVLSPQLLEFDFDTSELGIAVTTREEFRGKFIEMKDKYKSFKNCRKVAKQHLDGKEAIVDKLYSILTLADTK